MKIPFNGYATTDSDYGVPGRLLIASTLLSGFLNSRTEYTLSEIAEQALELADTLIDIHNSDLSKLE